MQISVEKIKVSGGYLVSAIIAGALCKTQYYGYTKKEALAKFRNSVKTKGK